MKKIKTQNGITLIALIITIVVLLILAVVAIGAAQESNIVGYAQNAAGKYEEGKGIENNTISKYENILSQYANGGQQSQTNNAKGIGTDGQPVNMDYWKYVIINEERKEVALHEDAGSQKYASYMGEITASGEIVGSVPQYIEIEGKEGTYTVTSIAGCFRGISDLKIAPEIPDTVTDMSNAFAGCTSLITAPTIPNGVTDMSDAFASCTSLITAPTIPNSVINMDSAFLYCTSLTIAPTIPTSVNSILQVFGYCHSLTGTIRIESTSVENVNSFIGNTNNINKIQVPAGSITETNIRNSYGYNQDITIETF